MPNLIHVHSYVRIPKSTQIFKCNAPHCTHTQIRKLLNGKASLCPSCGAEFLLDWHKLQRAVPKCDDCCNTAEARRKRAARDLMEKLTNLTEKELKEDEYILDSID